MKNELPDGWEWKKLGDVATVGAGNGAPQGDKYYYNGKHPFVRTYDVGQYGQTVCLKNPRDKLNDIALEDNKLKLWPKNTLLIPKSGASTFLNHRALLGEASYISSHLATVIPNKSLLPQYLYYWSLNLDAKHLTPDTNYPSLKLSDIKNTNIPVPSLETQHKIVAILEKAEDTKKLRAQADELSQQFLQNVFLEMFGDPVANSKCWLRKTLSELSSEVIDCPHSTPKHEDIITPYPCIRTTELKNGYINWSKMKYVNEEGYKDRTKRLVPIADDIVYGREGTFGEAIRIPDNVNICLGQRVMLFRPNSNLCNSDFLWALINSDAMYRQALKKTCGSTVGHINVKDIKKFVCICPPIEIQEQFSKIVKLIDSIRHNQQQSSQEIDNLFNALMQKAFTGDLIH